MVCMNSIIDILSSYPEICHIKGFSLYSIIFSFGLDGKTTILIMTVPCSVMNLLMSLIHI